MRWRTIRLRRLVTTEGGSWGTEPEEGDVVAHCVRGTDFDYSVLRVNLDRAPLRGFRHSEFKSRSAHRGDMIVEKSGGGEQQPVGRVVLYDGEDPVVPTNFAGRLRPIPGVDPRFICYLMASLYSQGRTMAAVKQTTGIQNLDLEALLDDKVRIPSETEQRRIVGYLDRETARIHALIAAKLRMAELLEERWQAFLEKEIRALTRRFGEIPLKHVCREVVVGIVVTPSAWYADSGIPAIRGTNVSPGAISSDDLVYLTKEGHELHPKSRLSSGDVVVVRTGQAGAAAVVPPELDGINCIDLVIIRLRRNYSPHFLEFVLNSDWMQKHIDEHSVGTIQSHFNVGAASVVPVPRAPLTEQDAIVDELRQARQYISGLVSVTERQVKLLQERRQALITATVTGQLDIPETA